MSERNHDNNISAFSSSFTRKCRLDMELHPLKNELILPIIFDFSAVEDLKYFRLVSKLWLNASQTSWRNKAVLKVKPDVERDQNPALVLRDLQDIYEDEMDAFSFRQKPFSNVKLVGLRREHCKHSEMNWIFETYSSNIRHVCFKKYEFPSIKSFLDTIILRLPNLVELKLSGSGRIMFKNVTPLSPIEAAAVALYPEHQKLKSVIIYTERDDVVMPDCPWVHLLGKVADLQDLRIISILDTIDSKIFIEDAKAILKAVARVRRDNDSKLQIKNLKISPLLSKKGFAGMKPRDVKYLSTMPLEEFTGVIADVVYLKSYSNTLKLLRLYFRAPEELGNRSEAASLADDDFTETEKITLSCLKEFYGHGTPDQVFYNLSKIEAVNLETIVVHVLKAKFCTPRLVSVRNIILDNPSFINVTRFELNFLYCIDMEMFRSIARSMPNVLHAKIPLKSKAFVELCRTWPQLLTLNIPSCKEHLRHGEKIDDEVITGIGHHAEPSQDAIRPPNITNLKKLTDLALHSFDASLTDHSVNHGFLHLPRLYQLDINLNMMSLEAISALQKKVEVLQRIPIFYLVRN